MLDMLQRRYRGLSDLDACFLMEGKEEWPGMVINHVIIPLTFKNYSGHQARGWVGGGGTGGGVNIGCITCMIYYN